MANVELVENPKGIVRRLSFGYSRRRFTKVVEPARAAAHHAGVLVGMGALETVVGVSWKKLDEHLRWLAIESVAGAIGCTWCTDYGFYEGVQQGVDPAKIRDVFRWRESSVYDNQERAVLEYAEVSTQTPVVVPEDLVRRLHEVLSEPEIVELAGWVALENFRSRFNAGMGLKSEGFSDRCEIPAPAPAPIPAEVGAVGAV
jgi:alkylhydroperoxidase family enzyme